MSELIKDFDLLDNKKRNILVIGLAEGPGGFLESIFNNRNKSKKNTNDKYICMTLIGNHYYIPGWSNLKDYNLTKKSFSNYIIIKFKKKLGYIPNLNYINKKKLKIYLKIIEELPDYKVLVEKYRVETHSSLYTFKTNKPILYAKTISDKETIFKNSYIKYIYNSQIGSILPKFEFKEIYK